MSASDLVQVYPHPSPRASVASIWVPWMWGIAAGLIEFLYEAYLLDRWWNRITAGDDRSDGFIQATSQRYPGADRQIRARIPTSHTGEPKTERSYIEVEEVLRLYLNVEPRAL